MPFQHPQLGNILSYKFANNPHIGKGMTTRNGVLIDLHPDIGPFPTDAELDQWVKEYESLPVDHAEKNPRAAKLKRLQGSNSIAALRQFIEEELL